MIQDRVRLSFYIAGLCVLHTLQRDYIIVDRHVRNVVILLAVFLYRFAACDIVDDNPAHGDFTVRHGCSGFLCNTVDKIILQKSDRI